MADITEHMEVVGSDGEHVGTVDKVEGQYLKLTKSDAAAGGEHHFLQMSSVKDIQAGVVHLTMPASAARDQWMKEPQRTMPGM